MNNKVSTINPNFGISPKNLIKAKPLEEKVFNNEEIRRVSPLKVLTLLGLAAVGIGGGTYAYNTWQKSKEPDAKELVMTTEDATEKISEICYQISEGQREISENLEKILENTEKQ